MSEKRDNHGFKYTLFLCSHRKVDFPVAGEILHVVFHQRGQGNVCGLDKPCLIVGFKPEDNNVSPAPASSQSKLEHEAGDALTLVQADKRVINCSQLLQEALLRTLS